MVRAEWVTQSKRVIEGKGKIVGIVLTSTADGPADATLYNGRDDVAPVLFTIRTTANRSLQIGFDGGVPVHGGLYIKLGSNVEGVLVLWESMD
ncbi:MAG: hypothetical protein J7J28_05335 [Thaumarchaeota archaeon]|nr:hypothetical protein [Nitrososphaerota archaeon]